MLAKLLERLPADAYECSVISLTGGGPIADRIAAAGIPVTVLGMSRGCPSPLRLFRLAQTIHRLKPDLVQAWMYHANLAAGLAAVFAGRPPVIWGIRQGDLDPRLSKWTTRAIARIGAYCSHVLADQIICCAENARVLHEAMGYSRKKMVVIANGFDLDQFHPDPETRATLRHELGLPMSTPLIAMAARFDPQKDHRNLLQAANILRAEFPQAHYILCGDRIDAQNQELRDWVAEDGLTDVVHLLGSRSDMARIMAASDIAVSSSAFGEGFPNVLGEAMAAGTPCVATDVGDSRLIIGDTGRVVPPRDPQALASALEDILKMSDAERRSLGEHARSRIGERYSLDAIAAQYEAQYRKTLNARI